MQSGSQDLFISAKRPDAPRATLNGMTLDKIFRSGWEEVVGTCHEENRREETVIACAQRKGFWNVDVRLRGWSLVGAEMLDGAGNEREILEEL